MSQLGQYSYNWELEPMRESFEEPPELCRTAGCSGLVPIGRWNLGYRTCFTCAEKIAKQQKHCIVPMHKSNYVLVTAEAAPELLAGINNKSVR